MAIIEPTAQVLPSAVPREHIAVQPSKGLIFGREPAAWIGLIEALVTLILVLWPGLVSATMIALIMAVITAGLGFYTAWVTKDTMLGVTIGLLKAILALAAGFGLHLTADQTGAVIALVTVVLGLFQRTQTSPIPDPSFQSMSSSTIPDPTEPPPPQPAGTSPAPKTAPSTDLE